MGSACGLSPGGVCCLRTNDQLRSLAPLPARIPIATEAADPVVFRAPLEPSSRRPRASDAPAHNPVRSTPASRPTTGRLAGARERVDHHIAAMSVLREEARGASPEKRHQDPN